jgi:hypothetical protein
MKKKWEEPVLQIMDILGGFIPWSMERFIGTYS